MAANLNYSHNAHTASLITLSDGTQEVLVVGGAGTQYNIAELYDYVNNKWTVVSNLNVGRYGQGGVLLNNGKYLVVGGAPVGTAGLSSEFFTAP